MSIWEVDLKYGEWVVDTFHFCLGHKPLLQIEPYRRSRALISHTWSTIFFDNHFSASIFHIIHIIRIEANSIRWVCFSFQNGVFLTERLLSWLDRFVDHQLYDCQECFWKPGVFGENYAIIFMLLVKISCEQSSSCIKLSLKK